MAYLEERIAHTESLLRRWHGHDARIHELTTSHSTLSVAIVGKVYGNNLVIYCISPQHICGPVNWTDSAITIACVELPAGNVGVACSDAIGQNLFAQTPHPPGIERQVVQRS
jgi:hypothetical protein